MPTENSNPYILAVSCFYHDSAPAYWKAAISWLQLRKSVFHAKNTIPDSPKTRLNKEPIVKHE
jgi:hypothetical protein